MIEALDQGYRKKLEVKKSIIKRLKEEKNESQKIASDLQTKLEQSIEDMWRLGEELKRMDDKISIQIQK